MFPILKNPTSILKTSGIVILSVGKVERYMTVPIWKSFYRDTHNRRSAINAEVHWLNYDHKDMISKLVVASTLYGFE